MRRFREFTRTTTLVIGAALTLSVLAAPAAGQDRIANGRFDTGIVGWAGNALTGPIAFDPTRDAGSSALSGSLEIVHASPPEGNSYFSQFVGGCVPGIVPGASTFFGGSLRFREGESSGGFAYLIVHYNDKADCKGASLGSASSTKIATTTHQRGTWHALRAGSTANAIVPPAGTKGIAFYVYVAMNQGQKLTLNADDVFLAPAGTPTCDKLPASIIGSPGPDVIKGTAGSDVIAGLGGADQIDGLGGNDRICGGPGADTLIGGAGDDRLLGDGGDDHLHGGDDGDLLIGGRGNDHLYGGAHGDGLKGGAGNDSCDGGTGVDAAGGCETLVAVP